MTKMFALWVVAALVVLTGCASPSTGGVPMHQAQADLPLTDYPPEFDPAEHETAPAVGLLTRPLSLRVLRWMGQAALQLITNTRIDLKIDATTKPQGE
jgi:hypothetical protein